MIKILSALTAAIMLLTGTTLQSKGPPPNEEWTFIGQSKDASLYLRDKDWLLGGPDTRKILVWAWYSMPAGEEWTSMVSLYEINCFAQNIRDLKNTLYDPNGRPTETVNGKWDIPTPGSLQAMIMQATCS